MWWRRATPPAWVDRLILRLGRDRSLLLNAGSLFGSTHLTAGLGAVYWAIAARIFPASVVGVGAAGISSMQLIAQLATFGLGTVLMGELRGTMARACAWWLSSLGLVASIGAGLAIGFLLVSARLVPELAGLRTPAAIVVFAFGVGGDGLGPRSGPGPARTAARRPAAAPECGRVGREARRSCCCRPGGAGELERTGAPGHVGHRQRGLDGRAPRDPDRGGDGPARAVDLAGHRRGRRPRVPAPPPEPRRSSRRACCCRSSSRPSCRLRRRRTSTSPCSSRASDGPSRRR